MQVLTALHTDVGIRKQTNQDSLLLKVAQTSVGKVVLAVVCDGMGGLEKGELASATVISAFSKWFDKDLPPLLQNQNWNEIQARWNLLLKEQNQRIGEYGKRLNINLGTTFSGLLIIDEHFFLIGHVGDTRVYKIDSKLELLTEDQTLVNREVQRNNLTPEQAEKDPRRNVLLQCLGASRVVEPQFISGKPTLHTVFMLCSDGFRHMISKEEIYQAFAPEKLMTEQQMKNKAIELVELNKVRNETDNISIILIKVD